LQGSTFFEALKNASETFGYRTFFNLKEYRIRYESGKINPDVVESQTIGFWSAFKLFLSIFKPSMCTNGTTSLRHMKKNSTLAIESRNPKQKEGDLQIGFTVEEMAIRVENVLKSMGLVKDLAPVIYMVAWCQLCYIKSIKKLNMP
jgi:uncharacterized protein YbcC (UPF0753/DUF2309 family)